MNKQIEESVFLLLSSVNNSFGTAFTIHTDEHGAYLLTCAHVVEACTVDNLLVAGLKAKVIAMGSSEAIDMAVIYVEGLVSSPLKLVDSTVEKGSTFEVNGFKKHLHQNHKLETLEGSVKKISSLYSDNLKVERYELSFEKEESIEKGYSGSAIICPSSGKVFAVSTSRYSSSHAEAIPIKYLKSIWEEMPEELIGEEHCLNKVRDEKQPFYFSMKKYLLETVGGVLILGVLTSFLYDYIKPKEDVSKVSKNVKQELVITGNNNKVEQVINEDTEEKEHCDNGIKLYEKTVNGLQEDYDNAMMPEIKKIIEKNLAKSQQQLDEFLKKCRKE